MMSPVLEDTAVPRSDIAGGLEVDFAGAVIKVAFGKVTETVKGIAALGMGILLSVDAEASEGRWEKSSVKE